MTTQILAISLGLSILIKVFIWSYLAYKKNGRINLDEVDNGNPELIENWPHVLKDSRLIKVFLFTKKVEISIFIILLISIFI